MQPKPHIRTLATALIALEYSLADFNFAETRGDSDPELDQLDELVSVLAEASHELIGALATIGHDRVNDPPELHSKH